MNVNRIFTVVYGCVALVGFVVLTLRNANPNTYILFVTSLATALGISWNNTKTAKIAEKVETIEHNTNHHLDVLTEDLKGKLEDVASDVAEVKDKVDGQQ